METSACLPFSNVRFYVFMFLGGKHWNFNIDMEEGQQDNQVTWFIKKHLNKSSSFL